MIFLLAAIVALVTPALAFTLGPLLLGPLHIVSGAVAIAPAQRSPRAFWLGLAIAAATFVALEVAGAFGLAAAWIARGELFAGVAWAAVVIGRGRRGAETISSSVALAWAAFAAVAWVSPIVFFAILIALHNVISIAIALSLRGERRSAGIVAAGLLVAIVAAPLAPGAGVVAHALGLGTRAAIGLLYIQLAHYAVWLRAAPELVRSAKAPIRAAGVVAAAAGVALVTLSPRLGGIAAVRAGYLATGAFHVIAEVVALTDMALGRARRQALVAEAA